MKPHRLAMTHQLVLGYGLHKHMEVHVSKYILPQFVLLLCSLCQLQGGRMGCLKQLVLGYGLHTHMEVHVRSSVWLLGVLLCSGYETVCTDHTHNTQKLTQHTAGDQGLPPRAGPVPHPVLR